MSDLKKAGYQYQKVSPNNIKIASSSFFVKPGNVYNRHVKIVYGFNLLPFKWERLSPKFSFPVSLPTGDLQDHKSQVH